MGDENFICIILHVRAFEKWGLHLLGRRLQKPNCVLMRLIKFVWNIQLLDGQSETIVRIRFRNWRKIDGFKDV